MANTSIGVLVAVLVVLAVGLFLWKEQQEIDANASAGGLKRLFGGLESSVEQRLDEDGRQIAALTSKVALLEENLNKLLRGAGTREEQSLPEEVKPSPSSTSSPTVAAKVSKVHTTTEARVDPTACSSFKFTSLEGDFSGKPQRTYEMVRLGATDACGDSTTDLSLFFAWQESGDCADTSKSSVQVRYGRKGTLKRTETSAFLVGCFTDEKHRTWRFYVARLSMLQPEKEHSYAIQGEDAAAVRTFVSPPLAQSNTPTGLIMFGDTQIPNARTVIDALGKLTSYHELVIHVGDTTYATNTGECFGDASKREANTPCGWNCTGSICASAKRMNANMLDRIHPWVVQYDASVKGRMPWMSTMGNHDNDLHWFLSMRPTVAAALPGVKSEQLGYDMQSALKTFGSSGKSMMDLMVSALDLMKLPHFYSFDHGKAHIISIGSEDNPNNAYEAHNGQPLNPELLARFEAHYGQSSAQYKWLEEDLKRTQSRRGQVPWVVLFTHRPLYHTSTHHPNCGSGGDWYVCLFRETYEPLFKKYSVNIVASGHSHHYSRSHPMSGGIVDAERGTVHTVVGTGGFELTNRFGGQPEWLAMRQGTSVGFVHLILHNATHAQWRFMTPSTNAESTALDETWITRRP